ncbi:MAG: sugar ABC transporter substrate-binding protein [Betaproteobacteria bacterium]|nr:sugar ABC transporter substrate-binding protein [Betaproteobacteria bacterium]
MNKYWLMIALWCPMLVWSQRVAFINPGKSDETYWVTASQSMQLAAESLNMDLEVRYAQREHLRSFDIARELIARPAASRPEYVIFSNDHAVSPELLRLFEPSGIKCFLAYSKPTLHERAQTGGPRQKYKNWIGSLEPKAQDAGYLTAKALIGKGRSMKLHAPDGRLHMVAIAGDRSTNSSILRNAGMRQAVKEAGDVVLEQEVYGDWTRDKAAEQAQWLYERYPLARLVWAGNDLMAFGAMQTLEQRHGVVGKTVLFSGVNTSDEALQDLRIGRLSALAGGHFITGAWALVMIYDHHHGKDFANEGLELELPMFALFTPALADRFQQVFNSKTQKIDFRKYSKALNPRVQRYAFGFEQLLK